MYITRLNLSDTYPWAEDVVWRYMLVKMSLSQLAKNPTAKNPTAASFLYWTHDVMGEAFVPGNKEVTVV